MTKTPFIHDDFLLQSETAKVLYHEAAKDLPIIDYHNHLPPDQIAQGHVFKSITEVWLKGDHYKWRAMRANGVSEQYITGGSSDQDKFLHWADTVPYTLRNPLYHWTHLELSRYFGIHELLGKHNATQVYEACNAQLAQSHFNAPGLLKKMKVEVICTTDEPYDTLVHHKAYGHKDLKLCPTFRPDKIIELDAPTWLDALQKLEAISNIVVNSYDDLLQALHNRIIYFDEHGCRLSDHGLPHLYYGEQSDYSLDSILSKAKRQEVISSDMANYFKHRLMVDLGQMYHDKDWTMQLHLGAIRNNNSRIMQQVGADAGCDSIGDYSQARGLSLFLNQLASTGQLPQTILYNLNPADNEVFATMAGNFNDGSVAGKIQWGSAWWFLDQKDGMEKQINVLSNMGLLSRFVGMLTDSRSFLSFPRHEYFRRILCDMIGQDVVKGYLPNDIFWLKEMVTNICYHNAKNYFKF